MPFLLFFENHIDNLVSRAKAVFKNDTAELEQFKQQLAETIREIEEHELIKNITDKFNLALWVKDKNSVFIFSNKPCSDLFANSQDPTFRSNGNIEKHSLALFCIEGDKRVMEQGEDIRFIEHAVYGRKSVWLDIYKSPMRNPHGAIYGTIGSAVSITDIVPEYIKEEFRKAQSIEIDTDVVLTAEKISEIIKEMASKKT